MKQSKVVRWSLFAAIAIWIPTAVAQLGLNANDHGFGLDSLEPRDTFCPLKRNGQTCFLPSECCSNYCGSSGSGPNTCSCSLAAGLSCLYSDACCAGTTCSATKRCCWSPPSTSTCSSDNFCCAGSWCDTSGSKTCKTSLKAGDMCSSATSNQCCSKSCTSNLCDCTSMGSTSAYCLTSSDCCHGTCTNNLCVCSQARGSCSTTEDCCNPEEGDQVCQQGTCCRTNGQQCNADFGDAECCFGMYCSDKTHYPNYCVAWQSAHTNCSDDYVCSSQNCTSGQCTCTPVDSTTGFCILDGDCCESGKCVDNLCVSAPAPDTSTTISSAVVSSSVTGSSVTSSSVTSSSVTSSSVTSSSVTSSSSSSTTSKKPIPC